MPYSKKTKNLIIQSRDPDNLLTSNKIEINMMPLYDPNLNFLSGNEVLGNCNPDEIYNRMGFGIIPYKSLRQSNQTIIICSQGPICYKRFTTQTQLNVHNEICHAKSHAYKSWKCPFYIAIFLFVKIYCLLKKSG